MSHFKLPPISPASPLAMPAWPDPVVAAVPSSPVESIAAPPLPSTSTTISLPRSRTALSHVAIDHEPAPASAWSRAGACLDPALGLAAAAIGIVAVKLPAEHAAARVLPLLSSALWTASGVAGLVGSLGEIVHQMLKGDPSAMPSSSRSHAINAVAAGLNGVAGGLSLRTPSMLRGGFESGAWAASGMARMGRAGLHDGRPLGSRFIEVGSGALTLAAAGLSAKALAASSDDDAAGALFYTLVSTATWVAADGLGGLSALAAHRTRAPVTDVSSEDPHAEP